MLWRSLFVIILPLPPRPPRPSASQPLINNHPRQYPPPPPVGSSSPLPPSPIPSHPTPRCCTVAQPRSVYRADAEQHGPQGHASSLCSECRTPPKAVLLPLCFESVVVVFHYVGTSGNPYAHTCRKVSQAHGCRHPQGGCPQKLTKKTEQRLQSP
jgi:hypothetical protein